MVATNRFGGVVDLGLLPQPSKNQGFLLAREGNLEAFRYGINGGERSEVVTLQGRRRCLLYVGEQI